MSQNNPNFAAQDICASVRAQFASQIDGAGSVYSDGVESFNTVQIQSARSAHDSIRRELFAQLSANADTKHYVEQGERSPGIEAAASLIMASANPQAWGKLAAKMPNDVKSPRGFIPASSIADVGSQYAAGVESFSREAANKYIDESIRITLDSARQSKLAAALFPIITLTAEQSYFRAGMKRVMVFTGALHTDTGAGLTKFNKRPLVEAYRDYSLLINNETDLVPFYNVTGDATQRALFLDDADATTTTLMVKDEAVPTRPLKMNQRPFSFLKLCQHPGVVASGLFTHLDGIAVGSGLGTLTIRVSSSVGGTASATIEIDVEGRPGSYFVKSPDGEQNEHRLSYHPAGFRISPLQKTAAGADVPAFAPFVAAGAETRVFELAFEVTGRLNLERSDLTMNSSPAYLTRVFNPANGAEVALSDAAISALSFEVIGFTLANARLKNGQKRITGKFLDIEYFEEIIPVEQLAPFTVQSTVNGQDLDKKELAMALGQAVNLQSESMAISTMLSYADWLEQDYRANIGRTRVAPVTGGDIEGIARLVVTPWFKRSPFDVYAALANRQSADKLLDIQGAFGAHISDLATQANQLSGYNPALRLHTGNSTQKPLLALVTDVRIPTYLMFRGEDRYAGICMDYEVFESTDDRMVDKIIGTFIVKGTGYQPLGFGQFLLVPEFVFELPVPRGSGVVQEMAITPRFRFAVNLPVMFVIDVLRLSEALSTRTPITVDPVVVGTAEGATFPVEIIP